MENPHDDFWLVDQTASNNKVFLCDYDKTFIFVNQIVSFRMTPADMLNREMFDNDYFDLAKMKPEDLYKFEIDLINGKTVIAKISYEEVIHEDIGIFIEQIGIDTENKIKN